MTPILMTTTVELPYDPEKHSRARVLASYVSLLVALGLELVAVEHGCVVASNPIEAGSNKAMARYQSWWNWIARRSKAQPRSALCLGPLVYVLDWVAMRTSARRSSPYCAAPVELIKSTVDHGLVPLQGLVCQRRSPNPARSWRACLKRC
jgi:hypothetical protein